MRVKKTNVFYLAATCLFLTFACRKPACRKPGMQTFI